MRVIITHSQYYLGHSISCTHYGFMTLEIISQAFKENINDLHKEEEKIVFVLMQVFE